MPIVATELRMYKSVNISNTPASNGGRRSTSEVVSGVNNNIFPDVSQAERVAGITSMRKVFYKNTNAGNLPLTNPRLFVENYTQGDDAVLFHAGTHTGMESSLTGTEKLYGGGKLDANSAIGATSLDVLIENAAIQFFEIGDVVRISDKANISSVTGNEEFRTLTNVSAAGSVVTITFVGGLDNAYTADSTRVANVYSPATIVASTTAPVVTTADNGDFAYDSGTNLAASNLGTIADDWTITFTGATTFTCAGLYSGTVGTGSTLADFSPSNPENSNPYFTLKAAGFSGVWGIGDTITFSTVPSDVPLWCKRVVPAGAVAISGNRFVIGLDGETA